MPGQSLWVERVLRVVDHIQFHLDEEISAESLAKHAGFSLHHFHRIFRGMTGESAMGFVRRLRLEQAAQHLKFGLEPVASLAMQAGYNSHEGFTRAFGSHFGKSPTNFRQQFESKLKQEPFPEFSVRREPERVCVCRRFVGPYEQCEQAWGELVAWTKKVGIPHQVAGSLGLVYDDPEITEAANLRYDAALTVLPEKAATFRCGAIPLAAGSSLRTIPGGLYAVALHEGSFDTILTTYVALLGQWLPQRHAELANEPVIEIYLNDPITTSPKDLRTEVCVRLSSFDE